MKRPKLIQTIARQSLKGLDSILWTDFAERAGNVKMGYHNPNYRFEKDQIAFVHLPKTGGTSLHRLLNEDKLGRFINLGGAHRPISRFCPPSAFGYVTVLRNPADRVWSFYQMVLRNPPGYPYQRFANRGLECFLKHCWEARNLACQYYTGEIRKTVTGNTLERAMSNLGEFHAVLSFDDFNEEAARFLAQFEIGYEHIPHERKSAYNLYSEEEFDLIRAYNAFDMRLFEEWQSNRLVSPAPPRQQ